MTRLIFGIAIFLILFFANSQKALALELCPSQDIIPNEYIVTVKNKNDVQKPSESIESTLTVLESFTKEHNAELETLLSSDSKSKISQKVKTNSLPFLLKMNKKDFEENQSQLSNAPGLVVEPNCRISIFSTPNDPYLNLNQGIIELINLKAAWEIASKASDVIVAVPDTGVDINHEDLKENIWINKTELNGLPGIDDDQNGYFDDIYGANILEKNGNVNPSLSDKSAHGTHLAGIIGAVGNNNIGMSGVAWKVQIMPIKAFDENGSGSLADLLKSIYYAVDKGAKIINCSWGSKKIPSEAEKEAVNYALTKNVTIFVAAGNSSEPADFYSPASIPGVFVVGSMNSKGELSSFSNYGKKISILSPGGDVTSNYEELIFSTAPNNNYRGMKGTSMATPLVSGVAALILSLNPKLSSDQIMSFIKDNSDTFPYQHLNETIIYPRLNVFKILKAVQNSLPKPDPSNCKQNCLFDPSKNNSNDALAENPKPTFSSGGCNLQNLSNLNSNEFEQSPSEARIEFYFIFFPIIILFYLKRKHHRVYRKSL